MNIQNNSLVVGLVALIVGLMIGYFANGAGHYGGRGMMDRDGGPGKDRGAMQDAMGGMMMGLQGKTGDDLDKAFLDGMILHHEGAVHMAQMLIAGTKRPELVTMGNAIITAQTAEIDQMKAWRSAWFPRQ